MIEGLPRRPRSFQCSRRPFTPDEMRFLGGQSTLVALHLKDCPIGDEHVRELRGLSRMLNLGLAGTRITDAALEDLAALPKLDILDLDRTPITGEGLRHFHDHGALKTLWLSGTGVTDETIGLAASIPRLSTLLISETAVTFDGLLALAANPKLRVRSKDGRFSAEQWGEFEATQRRLARRGGEANPEDVAAARLVLSAFFEAMDDWERQMAVEHAAPPRTEAESEERNAAGAARCAAIFERYCTPKARAYGRPNALSFSDPPEYGTETVVDAEQPSKHKVLIYTKDRLGFQRRYLVVRSRGQWRVDHREIQIDGWSQDYL